MMRKGLRSKIKIVMDKQIGKDQFVFAEFIINDTKKGKFVSNLEESGIIRKLSSKFKGNITKIEIKVIKVFDKIIYT